MLDNFLDVKECLVSRVLDIFFYFISIEFVGFIWIVFFLSSDAILNCWGLLGAVAGL